MPFPVSKRFFSRKYSKVKAKILPFLNITPLVDMFLIIIIFFLRAYIEEGVLPPYSQKLEIPESSNLNLLMAKSLVLILNEDSLYFQNKPVYSLDYISKLDVMKIDALYNLLVETNTKLDSIAMANNIDRDYLEKIRSKITIISDKRIKYNVLKKILFTCNIANYNKIYFALQKKVETNKNKEKE